MEVTATYKNLRMSAQKAREVVRQALAPLETRVAIEHVLEVPPVRMITVPGLREWVVALSERMNSIASRFSRPPCLLGTNWPRRPKSR